MDTEQEPEIQRLIALISAFLADLKPIEEKLSDIELIPEHVKLIDTIKSLDEGIKKLVSISKEQHEFIETLCEYTEDIYDLKMEFLRSKHQALKSTGKLLEDTTNKHKPLFDLLKAKHPSPQIFSPINQDSTYYEQTLLLQQQIDALSRRVDNLERKYHAPKLQTPASSYSSQASTTSSTLFFEQTPSSSNTPSNSYSTPEGRQFRFSSTPFKTP